LSGSPLDEGAGEREAREVSRLILEMTDSVEEVETVDSEDDVAAQKGDTVTVLVAVSVTVTGSQVGLGSSGGETGPDSVQAPSRMENLEV